MRHSMTQPLRDRPRLAALGPIAVGRGQDDGQGIHHRAGDARLAGIRMAHRRRRQPQRHGRGLLPQEGRAGLERRTAAAAHRERAHQRERAPIHDAEWVCRKHLRSGARHRSTSAGSSCPIPTASPARPRTSSRSARALNRNRPRAARSTTSIRPASTARSRSRRSPDCSARTTPARRAPTTSIRTRLAFSPATRSWCTPVSIRMTGTATAPVSARSRAAPTS